MEVFPEAAGEDQKEGVPHQQSYLWRKVPVIDHSMTPCTADEKTH